MNKIIFAQSPSRRDGSPSHKKDACVHPEPVTAVTAVACGANNKEPTNLLADGGADRITGRILSSRLFHGMVLVAIASTSVLAGVETYGDMREHRAVKALDAFMTGIFALEILLRIVHESPRMWNFWIGKKWISNWFDFLVVAVCVLPVELFPTRGIAMVPALRLLRLTKLVDRIPKMKQILAGLAAGVKSAGWIILLLLMVMYLYAIFAIHTFKSNNPWHFRNLPIALLSLFRATTLVDWSRMMYIDVFGCDKDRFVYSKNTINSSNIDSWWLCTSPRPSFLVAPLFWISFIVISSLVMLSLFVGSITLSMSESVHKMKVEAQEAARQQAIVKQMGELLVDSSNITTTTTDQHRASRDRASRGYDSAAFSRTTQFFGLELSSHEKARAKRRLRMLVLGAWKRQRVQDLDSLADQRRLFVDSPWRRHYWVLSLKCRHIGNSNGFGHFTTAMILMAGILVGVQTDEVIGANNKLLLDTIDALILAAFTAEMLIKVVQEGFYPWRFFLGSSHNLVNSRDIVRAVQWWNLFDFLIIGGNFIFRSSVNDGGEQLLSMMRLVRLLRVLKVVRAFPELQVIVEALITGLRSIAYIGALLSLVVYMYAILGTIMFAHNDPFHFGSLHLSVLTLFRVATLEGWSVFMAATTGDTVIYQSRAPHPRQQVSVVTTSMSEAKEKQNKAMKARARIQQMNLSTITLSNLKAAFGVLDLDKSGTINEEELLIGLQSVGSLPTMEELNEIMVAADVDRSGEIDLPEFIAIMVEEHKRRDSRRDSMHAEPGLSECINAVVQAQV